LRQPRQLAEPEALSENVAAGHRWQFGEPGRFANSPAPHGEQAVMDRSRNFPAGQGRQTWRPSGSTPSSKVPTRQG